MNLFQQESVNFENKYCSLMTTVLLDRSYKNDLFPVEPELPSTVNDNSLSFISGLYLYVNTPPHGYGTQAPKVAETVLRSIDYNKKKEENKYLIIDGRQIMRTHWEKDDGDFPFGEIHGNFSRDDTALMHQQFFMENSSHIIRSVESAVTWATLQNSDYLTQGRQTLCPITRQSVPASVAYVRMLEVYCENLGQQTFTLIEWITAYYKLANLDRLTYKTTQVVKRKVITKVKGTSVRKEVTKSRVEEVTKVVIGNDKVRKTVVDWARSFASYIKHKERGRMSTRAIASPNMILRGFLAIIERAHLDLSKRVPSSTISQGGEEKKAKIIGCLNAAQIMGSSNPAGMQGTEDATKWNECLSPAAFAVMHETYFNETFWKRSVKAKMSMECKIFKKITLGAHYLMAIKRIMLGAGLMGEDEESYVRIEYTRENLNRFNVNSRIWVEKILGILDDEGYANVSTGMLMGMMNAASTTYSLGAVNYRMQNDASKSVTK